MESIRCSRRGKCNFQRIARRSPLNEVSEPAKAKGSGSKRGNESEVTIRFADLRLMRQLPPFLKSPGATDLAPQQAAERPAFRRMFKTDVGERNQRRNATRLLPANRDWVLRLEPIHRTFNLTTLPASMPRL